MAGFEARVHALQITEHPNADRLELAAVGGYRCVVLKDQFRSGDLAAYVPEASLCPDELVAELGLEGKLAGPKKNRVKAVKLRGVLSQGLVYPVAGGRIRGREVKEGDDVTKLLGLTKYEPPIPTALQGEVEGAAGRTIRYDIENWKKYPAELRDGEEVVFTEKIHGTWCCFGSHPRHEGPIVTSKGLSAKGLVFKLNEANAKNLYVRTWERHRDAFEAIRASTARPDEPFYLLGEIYGRGVQDLQYGTANPAFRVFDCRVGPPEQGAPNEGRWLTPDELRRAVDGILEMVPLLYRGPFSAAAMNEHTRGRTTLGGGHVREGIVMRPVAERNSPECGRVILKSVSDAYLTRKNATEHE